VALVGLAINHAILHLFFRRQLAAPLEAPKAVAAPLLTRGSTTVLVVLAATTAAYLAGLDLAWTAVAGFALLMVALRVESRRLWERIDWSILLFFAGLFIAVEGVSRSGVAGWAFAHLPIATGEATLVDALRTAGILLLGSNVVTNVPFIMLVRPEMASLGDPTYAWEMLAMAATFAGNLTLLGSVANVIVAEKARSVGGLGFREHLRVGLPVAVVTTAVGAAWLHLLHR
jgi:Na+/H+ antiporter NhaD/arsenite permease-like protein